MAWVTVKDLVAKAGDAARFADVGGYADVVYIGNSLSNNERGAAVHMYLAGQEILKSLGLEPDYSITAEYAGGSDPGIQYNTSSHYSAPFILEQLKNRGINLAWDPARSSGNFGSSKGYNFQLGVIDSEQKPIQEFPANIRSIGSAAFENFFVPLASILLTANASAIGAAVAPGAPVAVQSAIGSAVASGASTALSGGDAEDVIENALTGGAVGAASSLVKPYIQDAVDFVKDLAPGDLQQIVNSVDATAATGDVASDLSDVDIGGVGDVGAIDLGADPLYGGAYTGFNTAQSYSSLTDYGKDVYAGELALGKSPDAALISAFRAESLNFPTTGNALATGGAAAA